MSLNELECLASSLYDAGWMVEDREDLKTAYSLTDHETEIVCGLLKRYEAQISYTHDLYELMKINGQYLVLRDNGNSDLWLIRENPKPFEEVEIANLFYAGKLVLDGLTVFPDVDSMDRLEIIEC